MAAYSQDKLKEVLDYNPATGSFVWATKPLNGVNAGDIAGWLKEGYRYITIDGKNYPAARLIFLYMTGEYPINIGVDHVNRQKDDNRWLNLRLVTFAQNSQNRSVRVDNLSGIAGVSWVASRKRWAAQISVSGRKFFLGRFKTKLEAVKKRWDAEIKYNFLNYDSSSEAYLINKNITMEA